MAGKLAAAAAIGQSGTSSFPERIDRAMRKSSPVDLKGLGYLISSVSVILLGIAAWPGPDKPRWIAIALVLGMAVSIAGMFVRYLSHRKDRRDIERAEADARAADGKVSR